MKTTMDKQLMDRAERICDGANTHAIRQKMALYRCACELIEMDGASEYLLDKRDKFYQSLKQIVIKEEQLKAKFL